jgi:fluoride exporter
MATARSGILFMNLLWYVALGSAFGGASRFALSTILQQRAGTFPIGTLVVNITGSLALGFLLRYSLGSTSVSAETRALLTTGFCGGYTTFSTFSYETIKLIEDGDYRRAAIYVGASVVLSLAATFLGIIAANELLAARSQ